MQENGVWQWSEAFRESVNRLMRDPRPARAARRDWPEHCKRLECWIQQVDAERELYRKGCAEILRALHDYWFAIADGVEEQAQFASETYRHFHWLAKSRGGIA